MEAQQAEATDKQASSRKKMSPEQAAAFREREQLVLSRNRVLQQIQAATNPRFRQMLEDALVDLDRKLKQLQ